MEDLQTTSLEVIILFLNSDLVSSTNPSTSRKRSQGSFMSTVSRSDGGTPT